MKWNKSKSPPILNTTRVGKYTLFTVSYNQYHPYELFAKSKYLQDPEIFPFFQQFVLSLWQLRYTTSSHLLADLLRQQFNHKISRREMIDELAWCVQNSAPRFQLCWPSVKYLLTM